jgi:predicted DNA-binding protein with PD1-like motif
MSHVDAVIFKKKGVRKSLRLILDENESILACIKQAMKEHNLREVRVEDMTGKFQKGELTYFEGNRYKMLKLADKEAFRASGLFKLSFDELYGSMYVSINQRHPITGTLTKGTAINGFEIKLSFLEMVDK